MDSIAVKTCISFLLTTVAVQLVDGRIFDRCSLARELQSLGVRQQNLPNWVCIALHESNYNTAEISPPNPDGSRNWGIFHISDRFWCDPEDGRETANACRVSCQSLITDDIRASVTCAQQIIRTQGFTAWNTWNNDCGRGANVPNLDDCN
ncbi:lysozyme X-like [Anastrepha obliqua]|uniref:lysozyme X-like n=1 Tax=Anastrepha obliqua TaxID=95512 RepID=UPI0024091329|nr:lysozyme X-like [Anastrepha obliqua]